MSEEFDNDKEYLVADYSVDVTTATYSRVRFYAVAMVLVWPFGVPLLYFSLLFSNRGLINPPEAEGDQTKAMEIRARPDVADRIDNFEFLYGLFFPQYVKNPACLLSPPPEAVGSLPMAGRVLSEGSGGSSGHQ